MKVHTANTHTSFTKLAHSSVIASLLLTGSLSAHALLPTPEPEMSNVTNTYANTGNTAANGIQTKVVAAIVSVNRAGQPILQPITSNTRLKSGNVVEYRTYITNTTNDRLRSMTVTMSIPDALSLQGGVEPYTASASVDGMQFSRMPLTGQINGQVQEVPLAYYDDLRWTVSDLGINQTALLKYRAVVR